MHLEVSAFGGIAEVNRQSFDALLTLKGSYDLMLCMAGSFLGNMLLHLSNLRHLLANLRQSFYPSDSQDPRHLRHSHKKCSLPVGIAYRLHC